MSTASLAKMAAENVRLRDEVTRLQEKVAAFEKRAAAEQELVGVMKDPRAPLDMRPVDVEDFLTKRAELEALPDLQAARTAIKMASARSFSVGESDAGATTTVTPTGGSKADAEFMNHFLGSDAAAR